MIQVYGIKNCNKMRDTFSWMEDNGIDYEFVDIKKEPLTRVELQEFANRVGLDVLVNRRGMKWRQLGLKDKDLSESELFEQLLQNQTMIKRPVLVKEEAILVGYDEDAFEEFVN
jgi:Spx/MgsR family transcriptional regulator